jgi:chromosome segregation ATPase
MSNDLMLVLAAASAAGLAGGVWVGWWSARQRPVADPEAEGRHELQLVELREAVTRAANEGAAIARQLEAQRQELLQERANAQSLEEQVAAYLRQYAQAKNALKIEIRQKGLLKTELAATLAQVESLHGRIRELEMERNAITGKLRRLSA